MAPIIANSLLLRMISLTISQKIYKSETWFGDKQRLKQESLEYLRAISFGCLSFEVSGIEAIIRRPSEQRFLRHSRWFMRYKQVVGVAMEAIFIKLELLLLSTNFFSVDSYVDPMGRQLDSKTARSVCRKTSRCLKVQKFRSTYILYYVIFRFRSNKPV